MRSGPLPLLLDFSLALVLDMHGRNTSLAEVEPRTLGELDVPGVATVSARLW
jgi:hypothetical protein